jgi:hypothetical protein
LVGFAIANQDSLRPYGNSLNLLITVFLIIQKDDNLCAVLIIGIAEQESEVVNTKELGLQGL